MLEDKDIVFFTNAEDDELFSEDIIKIFNNNKLDKKDKSINFIKDFDWKIIAEKDLKLFETTFNFY